MKKINFQRGQGMTEYIIIVAMVAVAAIATYQYFGETVRNQTAAVALEIAGEKGSTARNSAETSAKKTETLAKEDRDLKQYVDNTDK